MTNLADMSRITMAISATNAAELGKAPAMSNLVTRQDALSFYIQKGGGREPLTEQGA